MAGDDAFREMREELRNWLCQLPLRCIRVKVLPNGDVEGRFFDSPRRPSDVAAIPRRVFQGVEAVLIGDARAWLQAKPDRQLSLRWRSGSARDRVTVKLFEPIWEVVEAAKDERPFDHPKLGRFILPGQDALEGVQRVTYGGKPADTFELALQHALFDYTMRPGQKPPSSGPPLAIGETYHKDPNRPPR